MTRTRRTALATWAMVLAAAGAAGVCRAAGPDPRYVPADAKWLVHVDVANLVKSKTYGLVMAKAEAESGEKVREKLIGVGEVLGTRIPDDLREVTLIGREFDEKSAVLVVKGKLDKDRLLGMAKTMPGYTSSMHGSVEVSNWADDKSGQAVSGTFLADDVLVIGRNSADVGRMLDLAAGREKAASPSEGLLAGGGGTSADGAGVMVYLAGNGLAELQKRYPVSPLIAQVTAARAAVAERGDDLVLSATLGVTTPEIAKQVKGALEGFRALAGLAAMNDDGDDDVKVVAQVAKRAAVSADGATVTVEWPVGLSVVRSALELGEDGAAATRPVKKGHKAEKSSESESGEPQAGARKSER